MKYLIWGLLASFMLCTMYQAFVVIMELLGYR